MSQLISKVYNNIQYKIYKATEDPEAAAFATQMKKDQEAAAAAKAASAATTTPPPPKKRSFLRQTVSYTILAFFIFLIILFAIYTGHLTANDAIGRPVEYRVLFFIYGAIFSLFVCPYYIVQRLRGHAVKSYALLPVRQGDGLEGFFLSMISYVPDDASMAAAKVWQQSLTAAAT